jgi:hypothetical protein
MLCSRCGKEHSEPGIKLMLRGFYAGDARQIGVRQRTMPGEFDAACFAAELDEAEQRYQQRLVEVQAAQESKEEDVPWGQRWVVARLRSAGYEVTKPTTEGKQRVRGRYGMFAYVWETNKYVLLRAVVVEASPAAREVYQTLQPRLGDRIHPARKVLRHKNYDRMDIFLTGPSDYEALAQHLPLLERAAPGDAEGSLLTLTPLGEETECIWSDRDRHQTPHAAAWLATVRHARSGEVRRYRVCERDLGRLRQLYGREVA